MILTWKAEQENNRVTQHPEAGSKSPPGPQEAERRTGCQQYRCCDAFPAC